MNLQRLGDKPEAKPRSDALKELDKAEEVAFLKFAYCRDTYENTGAASEQIRLFEAQTTWSCLFSQILELEGAA